jgi:hypothetical protein
MPTEDLAVPISSRPQAAGTSSSGVRSEGTPKVCFSATVGREPEFEVTLV